MPTWQIRSFTRATRTISCPSSMVRVSGFSTYTSLPAFIASMAICACQWSGVATSTASSSFTSRSRRWSTKPFAPGAWVSALSRWSPKTSHTAVTSTLPLFWNTPMT